MATSCRAYHELSPVEQQLGAAYTKLAIQWFEKERKGVRYAGLAAKAFCCMGRTLTVPYTIEQMWDAK